MALLSLQPFLGGVSKLPVTATLVVATVLVNSISFAWTTQQHFVLQKDITSMLPWCLVTYAITAPVWPLLLVPLYIALVVRWGSGAESAMGSGPYALYLLFTVVVTALTTVLLDQALISPIASFLGCLAWMSKSSDLFDTHVDQEYYIYYGAWPIAHAIVFALCRSRGLTAQVGPSLLGRRVTLQQLPLALVSGAVVFDALTLLAGPRTITSQALSWYRHIFVNGWSTVVAAISMFVAWLYERHTAAPTGTALVLDAFFYPASVRAVVRRAGEVTYSTLQPTKLSFLLPPREGGMPMPVFAHNAATGSTSASATAAAGNVNGGGSADNAGGATLLPGTTAEEAERYRLIAREALARRLQEQRRVQQHRSEEVTAEAGRAPASANAADEANGKTA